MINIEMNILKMFGLIPKIYQQIDNKVYLLVFEKNKKNSKNWYMV